MSRLDGFEKRLLFAFTRALALVIVFVLILGAVIGIVWGASTFAVATKAHVTASELLDKGKVAADNGTENEAAQQPNQAQELADGVKMPFVLQKYFTSSDNREVLQRHLEDLSASEQQDYLDNLAEVVTAAETRGADATAAINDYFRIKDAKLAKAHRQAIENKSVRLYIAGCVISTLVLIALFSLVLVLLAIERNTRSVRNENATARGATA